MSRIKIVLIAVAVLALAGAGIGLSMYFKPHKDFGASKPDFEMTATQIVDAFSADESAATQKYVSNDKTLQISGTVRERSVNSDSTSSVVIDAATVNGSVSCTLIPSERTRVDALAPGTAVTVKGQCTGMQELIEKQVIMIRCVLVSPRE